MPLTNPGIPGDAGTAASVKQKASGGQISAADAPTTCRVLRMARSLLRQISFDIYAWKK